MSDVRPGPDWWQASDGRWYPPRPPATAPRPLAPPSVPTVADHRVGPDWWQASDGRWYPPHRAPGPSAGPDDTSTLGGRPPGPVARAGAVRRSLPSGLGVVAQGFLWAVFGLALIAGASAVGALVAFDSWWDTPVGSAAEADALDDWVTADDAYAGVAALVFLVGLVVLVLLVVWTSLAHQVTDDLRTGPRRWSPGWTIAAWFIPFANLVLPKLVLGEIERIALAPRTAGVVADGWQRRSTIAVGWLWWVPFAVGVVSIVVSANIGDDVDSSAAEVRASYVLGAVGFGALAFGAVCGALYVGRIGRRLSESGLDEEP